MCVCVCVCVCVYMSECVCVCVCVCECMHSCKHVYVCMHAYMCVSVYVCAWLWKCMQVYMFTCSAICVPKKGRQTWTFVWFFVCLSVHLFIPAWLSVAAHVCIHSADNYLHGVKDKCAFVCVCVFRHWWTQTSGKQCQSDQQHQLWQRRRTLHHGHDTGWGLHLTTVSSASSPLGSETEPDPEWLWTWEGSWIHFIICLMLFFFSSFFFPLFFFPLFFSFFFFLSLAFFSPMYLPHA